MKTLSVLLLMPALLVTASCATSRSVDLEEPKRLVGRESDVRLNAQINGDTLTPGVGVALTYEIENLRQSAIAVADLIPESSFDPESLTITINLGSEVPGNETVPRLEIIQPGEKRSFTTGVRLNAKTAGEATQKVAPTMLRIKVNFLTDVEPFRMLVGIPERIIHDRALASELFPKWVEVNDSVITNSIPIVWGRTQSAFPDSRSR